MLNRLLAGLVHPFIHLAYGYEFGLPGQVAEGQLNFRPFIYDSIFGDTRARMRCRPQGGTDRASSTFILRQSSRTRDPRRSDVQTLDFKERPSGY